MNTSINHIFCIISLDDYAINSSSAICGLPLFAASQMSKTSKRKR